LRFDNILLKEDDDDDDDDACKCKHAGELILVV